MTRSVEVDVVAPLTFGLRAADHEKVLSTALFKSILS